MTKDLSNCCQAPVKATHGCDDDFLHGGKKCTCEIVTSWYECEKCKQPCNVQIPIQSYTKEPEPTQKPKWLDEHACAFNDGNCTCECFKKAYEDAVQECYLQCLAVECGEGECAEAIRTKFPDLVTKYEI